MQTEPMIFVVDDDEAVRDSLKLSLEAAGHVVETYSSGVDFLDAAIAGRRGCLVLDLHMPDLNGVEVLKVLQRDRIALPAILITGRADARIKADAMRAGAVAIIDKPIRAELLLETINRAVETSSPAPASR
ncbi:MAG: response regulator [Proteobacteria bacterium]|nr:response regulator [Pseudomonadota bacterium]